MFLGLYKSIYSQQSNKFEDQKEVYIDEVWNLKNILEDSPIHNISFSENITVDSENNVTVTNDDILELDWNMKYVTLRCFTE